jgi:integrase
MEWTELDFEAKTWMVPAEKMKIKGELEAKPHLVPLPDQPIEIIQSMRHTGKYVFPSGHAEEHQPLRANALVGAIGRTAVESIMHGCRTSFRNWGTDNKQTTAFLPILRELTSSHECSRRCPDWQDRRSPAATQKPKTLCIC